MSEVWPHAIEQVKQVSKAPKHSEEDRRADAWHALRQAFSAARKDPSTLSGHSAEDMQAMLAVLAERGMKKTTLKNQAKETLDLFLDSPSWLAVAQASPELLATLETFFADRPALLQKLATPAGGVAVGGNAGPVATMLVGGAGDLISKGWNDMAQFQFQFPREAWKGMAADEATDAFESFFQGMQRLPEGHRSAQLDKLNEKDFESFLQFAEGLLEKKTSRRNHVQFVVKKWASMSPGFKEVSERRPAAAAAEAAAAGAASPPPLPPPVVPMVPQTSVVIWVDYKSSAYEQSALNIADKVQLQGFHDDPAAADYQPPEKVIEFAMAILRDPARRLDAVVLNNKHSEIARVIVRRWKANDLPHPKFVVVSRSTAVEGWDFLEEPLSLTTKWAEATQICIEHIAASQDLHSVPDEARL